VEAESLDEFLVAACDVVCIAVRIEGLQVRCYAGVLLLDCLPVLGIGFCDKGWDGLAYGPDSSCSCVRRV
jgi:hypothetical protein